MTAELHPTAVEATALRHSYGDRLALDGLDLIIPTGSVFGLLGPNGSGKSTFISLLAAMEAPTEGSLRVFGKLPISAMRARAGTVFQENAQDPLMTVDETLSLAGKLFGVGRGELASRSATLLGAFGLSERRRDSVATLSGGMRRRLEMARALLHDPDLLILDEPTTGVDAGERRAIWDVLLGDNKRGRTIILATNDLAEADAVCTRVAFLNDGKVVAAGSPAELKADLRREVINVVWDGVTPAQIAAVASWDGVGGIHGTGPELFITADEAGGIIPRLFAFAAGAIRSVRIDKSSLEDAYFQHVGERVSRREHP